MQIQNYNFSFEAFTKSEETPSYLAKAFLYNYERPEEAYLKEAERGELANKWYTYITDGETPPIDPDVPDEPDPDEPDPDIPIEPIIRKRRGYNFIIYNRRNKERVRKRRF